MYNNKTDDTQHKTKRGNNIENKREKKIIKIKFKKLEK